MEAAARQAEAQLRAELEEAQRAQLGSAHRRAAAEELARLSAERENAALEELKHARERKAAADEAMVTARGEAAAERAASDRREREMSVRINDLTQQLECTSRSAHQAADDARRAAERRDGAEAGASVTADELAKAKEEVNQLRVDVALVRHERDDAVLKFERSTDELRLSREAMEESRARLHVLASEKAEGDAELRSQVESHRAQAKLFFCGFIGGTPLCLGNAVRYGQGMINSQCSVPCICLHACMYTGARA